VRKPGSTLAADELLTFFDDRVAKWWKPDAVLFVDSVPLGATGKVLKNRLRDQFGDYYLPASDTDLATTQFHSNNKS
jgi:fatty-acyl-CoA synthase